MAFRMIAPGPGQVFQTQGGGTFGSTYTADANSVIASVANADVGDLLKNGCVLVEPSQDQTYFGGLTGPGATNNFPTFKEEGNLYRNVGNPIKGNAADTTDDILAGIALDASAFDIAGRGLCITAQGNSGNTANNKRFKMFINPTMSGQTVTAGVISGGTVTAGTPVVDSGTWTTTNQNVGWSMQANFFKYGAAGSNTQYVQGSPILGATHGGIALAQFLTATESSVINIVVTGSSYTTGAANDIVLNFFEVNAMD